MSTHSTAAKQSALKTIKAKFEEITQKVLRSWRPGHRETHQTERTVHDLPQKSDDHQIEGRLIVRLDSGGSKLR